MMGFIVDRIGRLIARIIERDVSAPLPYAAIQPDVLRGLLRPGDVILIDGNQKVSVAIKYLTQSTWSHAALYVGGALANGSGDDEAKDLIEVEISTGCHATSLSRYSRFNIRICRPAGLSGAECEQVVQYMIGKLGLQYDLTNIIDLVRYLLPTLPVPVRWRRRMIALGSGDPSRAICSSLIAQAFQSVRYPVLPEVESVEKVQSGSSGYSRDEIFHIRHHSLFTPRDFDLSPYFEVIKPTLAMGFDYRTINWADPSGGKQPVIG